MMVRRFFPSESSKEFYEPLDMMSYNMRE